jgi:RNA polymerase sigma-70 factor (sigma-E family)
VTEEQEFRAYASARQDALRRAAYLLCRDWHAADDLVQNTLVKVYLRWRTASRAENVDAWVHTVLVHCFLDERRRRWNRLWLAGAAPHDPPPTGAEPDVPERVVMQAALGRLTHAQRAVLVLRYYADLSIEQTAAALNCSTGNVKSQTHRGLAALRRVLTRDALTRTMPTPAAPSSAAPTPSSKGRA